MTKTLTRRTMIASAASATLLPGVPLMADEPETTTEATTENSVVTVDMLNKHPEDKKQRYVFYPRVVSVKPGDTVLFKLVDRGHNSASIKGMLPEGAEDWNGKINKDVEVVFDTPGFYGYMCTPHSTVGMVGLVVVEGEGKMDNLEDAQSVKHRGKSKQAWEDIWEEAEEMGLLQETTA